MSLETRFSEASSNVASCLAALLIASLIASKGLSLTLTTMKGSIPVKVCCVSPLSIWANRRDLLRSSEPRSVQRSPSATNGSITAYASLASFTSRNCVSVGTPAPFCPKDGPIHQRFVLAAARNSSPCKLPRALICALRLGRPARENK
eukprot:6177048-Pleurochrysis_carterae.AAC.9